MSDVKIREAELWWPGSGMVKGEAAYLAQGVRVEALLGRLRRCLAAWALENRTDPTP